LNFIILSGQILINPYPKIIAVVMRVRLRRALIII